ncbi:hypothetical protein L596_007809 [Steinernema carpocapsae]|uniref:Uncharacterized protein n=1 Tax=Steinernema carpocapsae TaxID=34508 RepID=A0A4U5PB30_STECR|nr:hypothetical protein L596_007809 [Steinernema carpocapsae]
MDVATERIQQFAQLIFLCWRAANRSIAAIEEAKGAAKDLGLGAGRTPRRRRLFGPRAPADQLFKQSTTAAASGTVMQRGSRETGPRES